jgi:hypothetical protein
MDSVDLKGEGPSRVNKTAVRPVSVWGGNRAGPVSPGTGRTDPVPSGFVNLGFKSARK